MSADSPLWPPSQGVPVAVFALGGSTSFTVLVQSGPRKDGKPRDYKRDLDNWQRRGRIVPRTAVASLWPGRLRSGGKSLPRLGHFWRQRDSSPAPPQTHRLVLTFPRPLGGGMMGLHAHRKKAMPHEELNKRSSNRRWNRRPRFPQGAPVARQP